MTRTSIVMVIGLAACGSKSDSQSSSHPTTIDAKRAAEIVAAPDRTDRDRKTDTMRKPIELLPFIGLAPGMHVADLGAGGGYTTELLARAVGPNGVVIAQDSPHWDGPQMQEGWTKRLARPVLANTKHVMRSWNDPLPAEAKDLDVVTFVAAYHDVVAEKDDETKLDAAVFAALKPGGVYIVIDNSAKAGSGKTACEPLHRIDEQVVRDEVQQAGFKLAGDAAFMRNPADTRDWNADPGADPRTHTQDLFVLKFVKP